MTLLMLVSSSSAPAQSVLPVRVESWAGLPANNPSTVTVAFAAGGPVRLAVPRYPGSLLAVTRAPTAVVQHRFGSKVWKKVGVAPVSFAASTSPDGRYVVTENGEIAAVGKRGRSTLPEGGPDSGYDVAFSPDGTRLAYSSERSNKSEGVVVYDLATGTHQVLVPSACREYTAVTYSGGRACGDVEDVIWVDPETLLVSHFTGDLPTRVDCFGESPASVDYCNDFEANTYSLVTTGGVVVAGMPAVVGDDEDEVGLVEARGVTVLLDDGQWLDLGEVRAGVGAPKPAPKGTVLPCLSPDGTRVVVVGKGWLLVDLRTGVPTRLGTRPADVDGADASCRWSPDGAFVAVQDQLTRYGDGNSPGPIWVVPASQRRGGSLDYVLAELVGWVA